VDGKDFYRSESSEIVARGNRHGDKVEVGILRDGKL